MQNQEKQLVIQKLKKQRFYLYLFFIKQASTAFKPQLFLSIIQSINIYIIKNQKKYNTQTLIQETVPDNEENNINQGNYSYIPFKFPEGNDQIYQFYQNEKHKKQEKSKLNREAKIWDKKTSSTNIDLKHFKNFYPVNNTRINLKQNFKENQKKMIQTALQITEERQKRQKFGRKTENLNDILKQKKEIFLITMSHDILENEIEQLKKQQQERVDSLIQSELNLKQDYDKFQKYLDINKYQKNQAELNADQQNKIKKDKDAIIKELNLKITSMKTEKSRYEELLQNYKEHKEFLDKISPKVTFFILLYNNKKKEWEDQKQEKKKQYIQILKNNWIQTNMEQYQIQFQQFVQKNELEELEEFEYKYPMYFQHHSQLIQCFNDLEEKNLFLIQVKQEESTNLEEFRNKFKIEKQNYNQQLKYLKQQKDSLKKQLDDINNSIKKLKQNYESENVKIVDKNENLLRNQ
ncbi:hypothetical protein IMG5_185870, partial [Ichthyophthirius multifiliis]